MRIAEAIRTFGKSAFYPKVLKTAKWLVLVFIATMLFHRTFTAFNDAYIEGDGFEYVLMTEAMLNHGTPDLRMEDLQTFKAEVSKHLMWDTFPKRSMIENYERVNYRGAPFKTEVYGFFTAKNDKYYCYHFVTYSIFNIPAGWFCRAFAILPTLAFPLTNSICIILVSALFLFYFSDKFYISVGAALCYVYGSNYWYLGWEHTEIFTTSLVAAGLIFLLKKRDFLSVLCVALAATQNQPLIILLAFLGLWIWWQRYRFNLKSGAVIALIASIALLPQLFYLYHYNTTNLIKDLGFLHKRYVTANRLFGYYFDLNQGLILALPLLLMVYLIFYLIYFRRDIKERSFALFIPLVCLIIGLIVISMGNWNGGAAIVHRYTTWLGAMVLIYVFVYLQRLRVAYGVFIAAAFVFTQVKVCNYFQKINVYDWQQESHNDIARWVLENHPDWYNPDPTIFSVRTEHQFDLLKYTGVIVYCDINDVIKKVMFNKKNLKELLKFGNFSKEELKARKFNYNWGYLKEEELKRIIYPEELLKIKRETQIAIFSSKILQNKAWHDDIIKKARDRNITPEEMLRIDAEFVIDEAERQERERLSKEND
ncbi:MAG: hypothetical protein QM534_02795 [Sediminibacterium sp.]|nr:hypothetical protein [Sediminibacterium sp.]